MLYPGAKTSASKRKNGQSAKEYTYNLIDVNKGKQLKEFEEENNKRQNVSYEEWLENDEYFYGGKEPGFWETVGGGLSFGVSKIADIIDPEEDKQGNKLASYRRDNYETWKNEYKEKLPSNITTEVVNPEAYRQNTSNENIITKDGVVKPGEYYLTGAETKRAEDNNINISNNIISTEEYNNLVSNRNKEKASTDIEKIEEHWDLNYDGDNSVSEVVEIGINNKFGVDDFKEGTYKLNGQSHNNKYTDGGSVDIENQRYEENLKKEKEEEQEREFDISGELFKLGDTDSDKRRYKFLVDQLDKDGDIYQKIYKEHTGNYLTWKDAKDKIDEGGLSDKETKYQEYVMKQNSDWMKMFGSEDAAQFAIDQKLVTQSMSSKLDYTDAELGDIEDMDDFNRFLEENASSSGLFEKTIFDENKGKWVIDNPIPVGNVWSGIWGSDKTDINKANLLSAYYNQKSQKLNNLQNEYETNGFYDK